MSDTRLTILEIIRAESQPTVELIAKRVGLSPISVRHHLSSLQAEGSVRVELQRQSVGRPKHIYHLTERANRYFPNQYHVLVDNLLVELKNSLPLEQVEMIIDRMAANVAARHGVLPLQGSMERRLQQLITVLGEEGVVAEVKRVGNDTILTAQHCPYADMGQRHPELCRIDSTLIQSVLGVDVEHTSCVLNGDHACTFKVNN